MIRCPASRCGALAIFFTMWPGSDAATPAHSQTTSFARAGRSWQRSWTPSGAALLPVALMLVQKVVCKFSLHRLEAHQAVDPHGVWHRVAAGRGNALTGGDLQTYSNFE